MPLRCFAFSTKMVQFCLVSEQGLVPRVLSVLRGHGAQRGLGPRKR